MGADLARYERELQQDPALAERILRELPAVEEPQSVIVRVRRGDTDRGIARALAIAREGLLAQVEIEGES